MPKRIIWPSRYCLLEEYILSKPHAEFEYKETWDARLYRLESKIFALLLRNDQDGTLLNLKCDPYLSLVYREQHPAVQPGWHMNKLHWISLKLSGHTPDTVCKELVDISYDLIWQGLPAKVRFSLLQ